METENNQVGVLRSDIKIELHTVPAIQIWYGRKKLMISIKFKV